MLAAVPAAFLLAGCGSDAGPPADPPTSASTTAPPVSTSAADVTTTSPPTTTSAPFTAADGTNLAACADGVCEVFVKTGDVLPNASGTGPVTVTVETGMIGISQVSASGMSSSLSGYPGMPQQINQQVFLIVAVREPQGVLRLSMAG
jgi:hypothetical protein